MPGHSAGDAGGRERREPVVVQEVEEPLRRREVVQPVLLHGVHERSALALQGVGDDAVEVEHEEVRCSHPGQGTAVMHAPATWCAEGVAAGTIVIMDREPADRVRERTVDTGPSGHGDSPLRATMDAMLDPHVVFAAVRDEPGAIVDFRYVDANAAACAYDRLSRRDLIGHLLLQRLPEVRQSGLFAGLCRVVETGEPLLLDGVAYESGAPGMGRPYFDMRGVKVGDGLSLTWRDVTDRHTASEALQAQRDLAVALSAVRDLAGALDLVMEAALALDGVDAGGVYLLDPESGDLRLGAHAGLSSGFITQVSHIGATTRPARIAKAGVSVFASHRELLAEPGTRREVEEGLRAFAALPVRHEGTVIAVVNLASRTQDDFTPQQSSLMETLAAQIGGVVARLRGEAELREELARLRAQHRRDAG